MRLWRLMVVLPVAFAMGMGVSGTVLFLRARARDSSFREQETRLMAQAVQDLGSPDAETRRKAIPRLARSHPGTAARLDLVIKVLRTDRSEEVREEAAFSLLFAPPTRSEKETVSALAALCVALADDESATVRETLAHFLPGTIEDWARSRSATTLARLHERIAPDLERARLLPDHGVRDAVDTVLSSLGEQPPSRPAVREFAVCISAGTQEEPAISGDLVVWEHWRELPGKWNWDIDIYGYRLEDRREFAICTAEGHQRLPEVSGSIVVWEDARNDPGKGGNTDIYGYDLARHRELTICTANGHQGWPTISGNTVVWSDTRNAETAGADIYGYDLSAEREFPICTAAGNQHRPVVSGQFVVWEDYRNCKDCGDVCWESDIFGYDLLTGREFPICTAPRLQECPAIDGKTVVWLDHRRGDTTADVYAFDLGASRESYLCGPAPFGPLGPSVSGSLVAWQRQGRDKWDIYGYDLSTQREFKIADGGSAPAVSGRVFVWVDARAGTDTSWDIYGAVVE